MAQPFVLQFEVAGDVQIARAFSRFADDVKNLSEAWREIADDFQEGEKKQFQSEGGYGSGGWQPLAPATVERKARGGFPDKMLVRTGDLMASLTGGGKGIREIRPLQLRVGTTVPYAIFHQKGTSRMPARPVIQLPEEQKTRWHKIIHKYLVQEMKKEFAGLMPTARAGAAHVGGI